MRPRVLLVAVLILGLSVFGYLRFRQHKADKAPKPTADRVVPVGTAVVERRDQPLYLEGIGSVLPLETVTIRAQVAGKLDRVLFKEGEDVKKGQLLAQVDPRKFAIDLRQAEANLARDKAALDNAKLNLGRFSGLRDQGLAAPQQVDDQRALVDQATAGQRANQTAIEAARLNLTYARITAPIDGRLGVRLVDQGNLVGPNDPTGIVVITQLDPIAVLFSLPEDDLPTVQDAMKSGALTVEAFARDGRRSLAVGTVSLIDNQINTATGTIRLKAIFPNGEHRLWPNQFVKARVRVSTREGALVVPAAVVQRGPKGSFAYVVEKDSTVSARPVVVDRVQGETAVLAKGLEVGEHVVVDGQFQLKPGGKVSARPSASSGAGATHGPVDDDDEPPAKHADTAAPSARPAPSGSSSTGSSPTGSAVPGSKH
jgi:membrane fusion protein, multidrug efflux system